MLVKDSQASMDLILEQARKRLSHHANLDTENPSSTYQRATAPTAAAVLIPMLKIDGDWHLLFIRRADNDRDDHSGQVAFPGGRFEPRDADLRATALRETFEEIGMEPQDVDILGKLGDLESTTGYRIAPFVGVIAWPYPLRVASDEVARAFTIPLSWLCDPNNREVYDYAAPSGKIPVIRYQPYDGELLWGATARMTVSLMETLSNR